MGNESNKENTAKNLEKKSNHTALKVAGGILAGAAAGGLAGILLAPDSGKNTRKKIVDKTKAAATEAKGKVIGKVKEMGQKITKRIKIKED